MRAVVLVALCLALGGVALGAVPAASACTSDPAIICAVLNTLGECQVDPKAVTGSVKQCLP